MAALPATMTGVPTLFGLTDVRTGGEVSLINWTLYYPTAVGFWGLFFCTGAESQSERRFKLQH